MARTKRKAPRRSRGTNLLRLGYAFASTDITMRAITGNGIYGFVTGKGDIRPPMAGYTGSATYANPDKKVSLADVLQDPANSSMEMASNLKQNFVPLILGSVGLNIGFKVGKKLLAPQRREANYLIDQVGMKGVAFV
jgi:hypothetical protein